MIVKVKGYMIKKLTFLCILWFEQSSLWSDNLSTLAEDSLWAGASSWSALSELVLVAGVHKYFLKSFANKG